MTFLELPSPTPREERFGPARAASRVLSRQVSWRTARPTVALDSRSSRSRRTLPPSMPTSTPLRQSPVLFVVSTHKPFVRFPCPPKYNHCCTYTMGGELKSRVVDLASELEGK